MRMREGFASDNTGSLTWRLRVYSQHVIVGVYSIIFGLGKIYGYRSSFCNSMLTQSSQLPPCLVCCDKSIGSAPPSLHSVAEFQIPPQVARYASFMFSFIGRGVCTLPPRTKMSFALRKCE